MSAGGSNENEDDVLQEESKVEEVVAEKDIELDAAGYKLEEEKLDDGEVSPTGNENETNQEQNSPP